MKRAGEMLTLSVKNSEWGHSKLQKCLDYIEAKISEAASNGMTYVDFNMNAPPFAWYDQRQFCHAVAPWDEEVVPELEKAGYIVQGHSVGWWRKD